MLEDDNSLLGDYDVIEKARILSLSEKRVLQALIAIEHEGAAAEISYPPSDRSTEE
jgi:hypothetical protein